MGIRQIWNDAIGRIADTNQELARTIRERFDGERAAARVGPGRRFGRFTAGGPSLAVLAQIHARHGPQDLDRLFDCLVWLIWCKLKDSDRKHGAGRFWRSRRIRGRGGCRWTRCREYLRDKGYAGDEVDELLQASPAWAGTLRQWLGKAGYGDTSLEPHLFELELGGTRLQPPQEVLDDLYRDRPTDKERQAALDEWRNTAICWPGSRRASPW